MVLNRGFSRTIWPDYGYHFALFYTEGKNIDYYPLIITDFKIFGLNHYALFLLNKYKKNGPPITAIIISTGSSNRFGIYTTSKYDIIPCK